MKFKTHPNILRLQIGDMVPGLLLADLTLYYPNGKTLCITHTGIVIEKPDWNREPEK